ncbi:MAG: hypothetical protein DRP56_05985 [Planctomycetota bacterium]|nr:MAG: hypothetical protein DRP56_05985 [Planctomycetota bacterium]
MKTISELSVDTRIIYDHLSKMKKGDFVEYETLTNLISKDVQGSGRGNMATARKMALRNDGLVFDAVTNKGLKCLTDEENVNSTGESALDRIRRTARRSAKRLVTIDDFSKLSPVGKIKHNAHLAILGAIGNASKKKTIKKIEAKTEESGKISAEETIGLFR